MNNQTLVQCKQVVKGQESLKNTRDICFCVSLGIINDASNWGNHKDGYKIKIFSFKYLSELVQK